ncbi:MAG: UbiA family prenyltransferase [Bacteroidetes bacterium]|nr:UbiA family prenyltransferase [Bacteroidota bacterium]
MLNQYSIHTYKLLSPSFIRAYFITMRPYLLFLSGITGIAGLSFVSNLNLADSIIIFSASFLSYGFGQALTDCFQIDTDSISSPYRPLTQGIVSRTEFLIISAIGLSYCITVFSIFYPPTLILGIIAGVGLTTYTNFKKKWWAGPFYNSWIVALLFLMAYLSGDKGMSIDFSPKFIFTIAAVFFAYSNFVLVGYFKDIEADRATGYNTLPVVYGKKWASFVSDIFGISAVVFTVLAIFNSYNNLLSLLPLIPSLFFLLLGAFNVLSTQLLLRDIKKDSEAHIAVVPSVKSYVLLLSAIIASQKPEWILHLFIFYFCFLIVLKFRPSKNQI